MDELLQCQSNDKYNRENLKYTHSFNSYINFKNLPQLSTISYTYTVCGNMRKVYRFN